MLNRKHEELSGKKNDVERAKEKAARIKE